MRRWRRRAGHHPALSWRHKGVTRLAPLAWRHHMLAPAGAVRRGRPGRGRHFVVRRIRQAWQAHHSAVFAGPAVPSQSGVPLPASDRLPNRQAHMHRVLAPWPWRSGHHAKSFRDVYVAAQMLIRLMHHSQRIVGDGVQQIRTLVAGEPTGQLLGVHLIVRSNISHETPACVVVQRWCVRHIVRPSVGGIHSGRTRLRGVTKCSLPLARCCRMRCHFPEISFPLEPDGCLSRSCACLEQESVRHRCS